MTRSLIAIAVLFVLSAGLQAARDNAYQRYDSAAGMLWVQPGPALSRLALGYRDLLADIYWMRAIVYFGGERLRPDGTGNYDLLYPMLQAVTTLDPRFTVAYRFGAIFLAEAAPDGPGRPDLSVQLLESGVARDNGRWEYMHDIGFVYYWWLRDYKKAAEWFQKGSEAPGGPAWLAPMAATTLAVGRDRQSSRTLWTQLRDSADSDWIRNTAERSLLQLDAMDAIDQLNAITERYASAAGRVAADWQTLVRAGALRGIPLDPAGVPFVIDPSTGRVGLAADSPLAPLPEEPRPVQSTPGLLR